VLESGKPIERSVLAGKLWPDSAQSTALHNLRQALTDLRRALGQASGLLVAASPRSIRLNVDLAEIDVLRFDRECEVGDPQSLERAVELYRGELLPGCDEPWAAEARDVRTFAYLHALERLALSCRKTGDLSSSIRWLRLAAKEEPYGDAIHRDLMSALADRGELSAAADFYHTFRERLHRDLNAIPDPATSDTYECIRRRTSVHTPAGQDLHAAIRPRQIPAPVTNLIGRESSAEALRALLERHRLVTLTGIGGIGKTRLALQIASELRHKFDNRLAYVEAAPIADPSAFLEEVRVSLGIPPADPSFDALDWIAQYVSTAEFLIILDNCEHILPACSLMADRLLNRCPKLTILTTSREPLGIPGEKVWTVPPLTVGHGRERSASDCAAADAPGTGTAVQLFVERAGAVRPGFRLSATSTRAVEDICLRLEGIPLAIELAAARVRALSVEQIHLRLADGLELLARGGPSLHPRHHTLEAAFEWGWNLLSEFERVVLRRLSVFADGCTLEAAEAVCADAHIDRERVIDLLTALVDKSLLNFYSLDAADSEGGPRSGTSRYRLLEPVRQFAWKRLDQSGESAKIRDAHCGYYVLFAEFVKPHLREPDQGRWFAALEYDHNNLRSAIAWSRSRPQGVSLEFRLVDALSRFWDTHGHLREGYLHLEAALDRANDDVDPEIVAALHSQAGWAAYWMRDRRTAIAHYESSIHFWRETNNQSLLSGALNILGGILADDAQPDSARRLLRESLSIRRELGSLALGAVLCNLGQLELRLGNFATARTWFAESVTDCEKSGSLQQAGITHCNLCALNLLEGDLNAAAFHGAASLRKFLESGAHVNVPATLDNLALIAFRRGLCPVSATLFGAATSIRSGIGIPTIRDSNHTSVIQSIQDQIGTLQFQRAFEQGSAMSTDQAIEFGSTVLLEADQI